MPREYETTSLAPAMAMTGLIAGSLDAAAAIVHYTLRGGTNPVRIFEYIASGAFGPAAFTGGPLMPLAGLFFHFVIAGAWTILFYLAYPRLGWLRRHWITIGVAYGVFVWVVMNRVVLPLSHVKASQSFDAVQAIVGAVILIFCIGLPIAFRAHSFYASR